MMKKKLSFKSVELFQDKKQRGSTILSEEKDFMQQNL